MQTSKRSPLRAAPTRPAQVAGRIRTAGEKRALEALELAVRYFAPRVVDLVGVQMLGVMRDALRDCGKGIEAAELTRAALFRVSGLAVAPGAEARVAALDGGLPFAVDRDALTLELRDAASLGSGFSLSTNDPTGERFNEGNADDDYTAAARIAGLRP